ANTETPILFGPLVARGGPRTFIGSPMTVNHTTSRELCKHFFTRTTTRRPNKKIVFSLFTRLDRSALSAACPSNRHRQLSTRCRNQSRRCHLHDVRCQWLWCRRREGE